ncbi:MAG: hypothetical protein DBX66_01240 [Clostridiales bacterium]|uniref:helix-turn-helix domain-containing protein n=1 Tax=Provencibacterium massiliense TaxID=1841868 RepID=UPI0009A576DB|nr:helix-turn-helix domain-containing protein [Provencibacterium massiliense]PWM39928.1 MAG: hypothetical protein DBX66_01240 [Clostridiales bacterium]RGB64495.1 helix-turn-helix domain-containing protein [Harryflintia acetispora]
MNILLVDDDRYVLEGIKEGIDWSALPIEGIYTAQNAQQAKRILLSTPVQILVSDIEMPRESGLDLLEWVNGQGMKLQNIFLTSYAQFGYAQRAVSLGSFEYFLKPIEYDKLQQIIGKAAEKVRQEERAGEYCAYGEYWVDNRDNIRDYFWRGLCELPERGSREVILRRVQEYKLPYDGQEQFLALYFRLWGLLSWEDGRWEYAFQNIAKELFAPFSVETVQAMGEGGFLVVLSDFRGRREALLAAGRKLIASYRQHFSCEVCGYLCEPFLLVQFPAALGRLARADRDNLTVRGKMLLLSECRPPAGEYLPPDQERLGLLFERHDAQELHRAVEEHLAEMERRGAVSRENFKKLRFDMLQLLFSKLYSRQIEARRLFSSEQNDLLYARSLRSVAGMREYLEYLIDTSLAYGDLAGNAKSVAGKMCDYIEENLGHNITRHSLSEALFFSPDYLARLFKREMGVSIASYLLERRMERARVLLSTTRKSIHLIAQELGYESSSYFCKLFKKRFGVTPNEFRSHEA